MKMRVSSENAKSNSSQIHLPGGLKNLFALIHLVAGWRSTTATTTTTHLQQPSPKRSQRISRFRGLRRDAQQLFECISLVLFRWQGDNRPLTDLPTEMWMYPPLYLQQTNQTWPWCLSSLKNLVGQINEFGQHHFFRENPEFCWFHLQPLMELVMPILQLKGSVIIAKSTYLGLVRRSKRCTYKYVLYIQYYES